MSSHYWRNLKPFVGPCPTADPFCDSHVTNESSVRRPADVRGVIRAVVAVEVHRGSEMDEHQPLQADLEIRVEAQQEHRRDHVEADQGDVDSQDRQLR